MTHVDRSVFTEQDYAVIDRFVGMFRDIGMSALLANLAVRDSDPGMHQHDFALITEMLRDVMETPVEHMHEAAVSFMGLCQLVEDELDFVPDDFMPSQELLNELEEQFWNYQRDLAEGRMHELRPKLQQA